uniref:Vesicular glutamate transporter 2 n=1 Tax=Schistosoma haematobium TaxID=6185 RepID=A0A095BYZ6_SCHHA
MNVYNSEIVSIKSLHSNTSHVLSSSSNSSSQQSSNSLRAPSITGLPQLKNLTAIEINNINKNPFITYPNDKYYIKNIPNIINTTHNNTTTDFTDEIFQTNGQLLTIPDGMNHNHNNNNNESNLWNLNYNTHSIHKHKTRNNTLFCGPGRKRYLIAFLCCTCLTIVIGMRSEMLGIITNLNNTNTRITFGIKYTTNMKYQMDYNHHHHHYLHNHMNLLNRSKQMNHININGSIYSKKEQQEGEQQEEEDNDDEVIDHELHTDSNRLLDNIRPSTSLIFKPSEHRKMPWTETIKNDIVENSVFFAYLITSPIGGYLTVNYDSSFLLGSSVAITCGMNLFLPLVETIGNNINAKLIMIILLRLIQGLAEGCLIPSVFGILRFWSPINERSTLVCLSVIGVSLGPLIGLPVCAEIEKKWGWGVVFYIYANLGLIWCIFWWRLIDEKPNKDKKLNKYELNYLKSTISNRILYNHNYTQIPWNKIFTSRPVYAILFTYAADDWTFQISSVCMQSFYQQIYNVDVERGIFADLLRINTKLSRTTIHKLFAGLGFGLKGFSGLAVAGYAVNVIDLAPNFSGLVMGFANSVSTFTGILSTFIASVVVHKFGLELKNGWRVALCLAAFSQFVAMITYLLFSSSEQQSWAYSPTIESVDKNDDDVDDDDDNNNKNRPMEQINHSMI